VRIVGSIVAPTTLLTALLFYFGWSFAYWFFAYFGVDSTVLGLTTQD
jgi:Zn-dependent protease with chaperone function